MKLLNLSVSHEIYIGNTNNVWVLLIHLIPYINISQVDIAVLQEGIPWDRCAEDLGVMLVSLPDRLLPPLYLCGHCQYLWRRRDWPGPALWWNTLTLQQSCHAYEWAACSPKSNLKFFVFSKMIYCMNNILQILPVNTCILIELCFYR